jgi:DNA-binding NarL/FixJ family response regulator
MTGARPYRVLIIEDHQVVAEGLVMLLEDQPDLDVVGWAGSVARAGQAAAARPLDVAIVDYRLPDGTGVEAVAAMRASRPDLAARWRRARPGTW